MESLLKTATRGKVERPPFVIIYGQDGVGKSSLCSEAPDAVFVGPEDGTDHLNVVRVPNLDSYEKNINILQEIKEGGHSYKNLIFESIDHMEKIIFAKVAKEGNAKSVAEAYGGWGKGFAQADKLTFQLIDLLQEINKAGMGVFVTSHYKIKNFSDPNTDGDYQRYMIKTREETSAYWKEKVDAVLFAHYEVEKGKDAARAFGDGTRLLGTVWSPAYEAKNRFGLPETLPMVKGQAYSALMAAITESKPDKVAEYKNEIKSLRELLNGDPERLEKLDARTEVAVNSEDIQTLKKIIDQLNKLKKA